MLHQIKRSSTFNSNKMKRFFRFCLLLCLPLLILVLIYVMIDPFKVIWHYDVYYQSNDVVGLNRGYVSAMHYSNHQKDYNYDSFIFGNSRSFAYHGEEWKKYIPESSVCYQFNASGGSVGELLGEVKFINKNGTLKNALLILDRELLSRTEMGGILFAMPPILKNGKGSLRFQIEYFNAFYSIGFLKAYIDYKISNIYKPYMGSFIINNKTNLDYDLTNNELFWDKQEQMIAEGNYYTAERVKVFDDAQFPGKVSEIALNNERIEMLREIKNIFDAQRTDYRIVISPIFDQIKINPSDLQCLNDIFGQNYVFDFSGVNKWTADYHNYYENSHYRTCVANEIMQIVYLEK